MAGVDLFYDLVKKIVVNIISAPILNGIGKMTTRVRVNGAIENFVAQVIEPLEDYFRVEGLTEQKQELLAIICTSELNKILQKPEGIYSASLDGQKIFDMLYSDGSLPEAIHEENLEHVYSMVFPRIAHMICVFPPFLEQWKKYEWKENYKRLDDLANALSDLTRKVEALAEGAQRSINNIFTRTRQALLQKAAFQIDLTGLRADQTTFASLDDMFVVPRIDEKVEQGKINVIADNVEEHIKVFISQNSNTVLTGAPGAGKSTWSQWIQKNGMSATSKVVLLIRLRSYTNVQLPSLEELLKEQVGPHLACDIDSTVLRTWRDDRNIAIILDGFDEIPPERRDAVYDWIVNLQGYMDSNSLIITTRPLSTDHMQRLSDSWKQYLIAPFDQKRVVEYIIRWYRHAPLLQDEQRSIDATNLATGWANDPVIKPLIDNPLMLSTLLMVHHLDGELPRGRSKLYDRYTRGMIGLRDKARDINWALPSFTTDQKVHILTMISIHFQLTSMEQMGENEICNLLKRILESMASLHNASAVLSLLRERTGLLIGPGTYNFVHKSVSEFFVAQAIFQGCYSDEHEGRLDRLRLFAERHQDRWNTILFFWTGLTSVKDLEEFIEEIISSGHGEDYALVWGMIYDQRDRIPREWSRSKIIQLLHADWPIDSLEEWAYAIDCPGLSPSKQTHKTPKYRGISHLGSFKHFNDIIKFYDFEWEELKLSSKSFYTLIWYEIITKHIYESEKEKIKMMLDYAGKDGALKIYTVLSLMPSINLYIKTGKYHLNKLKETLDFIGLIIPKIKDLYPILILHALFEDKLFFNKEFVMNPEDLRKGYELLVELNINPESLDYIIDDRFNAKKAKMEFLDFFDKVEMYIDIEHKREDVPALLCDQLMEHMNILKNKYLAILAWDIEHDS